jgi:hypothetical protein
LVMTCLSAIRFTSSAAEYFFTMYTNRLYFCGAVSMHSPERKQGGIRKPLDELNLPYV